VTGLSLNVKASLGTAALAAAMALSIFLPAGTVAYWQGWVYLAVFFTGSILTMIYLMRHDPALLQRRVTSGPMSEQPGVQRVIMRFTSIGFIALMVVPGLDHRFGWSNTPAYVVVFGDVLVATGFYVIFVVYKANTFTAATVRVEPGQHVISTGPYAIVRHPMYAGGLVMLLGMPLGLASYFGLLPAIATAPFLVWRLIEEERLLVRELPGYIEYQRTVRWRLIPGVF
jgi:protein-S-isoprenylcysteine O-methyltransferase Ste14